MKPAIVGLVASPVAIATGASLAVHIHTLDMLMPVGAVTISLAVTSGLGFLIGRASTSAYPGRLRARNAIQRASVTRIDYHVVKPISAPTLTALSTSDDSDAA